MKHELVALVLVLLFLAVASAQEEKVFEPEYFSVFYYLGVSGHGIELERQIPNQILKGDKFLLTIPSEKSPVRFNADSKMQFIVRVTEDFDKATATMQLMRFDVHDGMRQLSVKKPAKNGGFGTGLKLNAAKYGSSSIKLTPSQEMLPGEYCLSRTTIRQGFCFGIDATGTHQMPQ